MRELPDNLVAYKKTAVFTEETVPTGLLNHHNTRAATWGLIQLESGTVDLVVPEENNRVITLSPERPGIVAPEIVHHLKVTGPVRFAVSFMR